MNLFIEKDVGLHETWFGKIVIIVSDYRARIRLILRSKNKIKVELDVKRENLENLLCKYYCVSEKGKVYQRDIKFEKPEKEVEFEDEISAFYFYLITKEGEIIDYKEGTYLGCLFYPTLGIKIELAQEFLESIIEKGENEHVEFKEKIPKDTKKFVESIVAFSNSKGGIILLGVTDDHKIVGVQQEDIEKHFKNLNEKNVQEWVYNVIRDNCEPTPKITDNDIKIIEDKGKKIVLINVPEGENKPYLVKRKGPFIRVGSSDRIMTRFELEQIYSEKRKHQL